MTRNIRKPRFPQEAVDTRASQEGQASLGPRETLSLTAVGRQRDLSGMPQLKLHQEIVEVRESLGRLEAMLTVLIQQRAIQEWYSTMAFARLVGRRPFTVRQWCNEGRIRAEKRACGRGRSKEWSVSHEELRRYQNQGLLPAPATSTKLS